MLLLIFRFKKRGGGGSSCLKGAKWWWWKSKKGKTFLFFFWGGEGKAWDAFYLLVIHATDTALLAPPSEEGCLEAPGRNSAKSAVVVRRSLLKRGRGGEQKAWSEKSLKKKNSTVLDSPGSNTTCRCSEHDGQRATSSPVASSSCFFLVEVERRKRRGVRKEISERTARLLLVAR